jgi:hypothetical protein
MRAIGGLSAPLFAAGIVGTGMLAVPVFLQDPRHMQFWKLSVGEQASNETRRRHLNVIWCFRGPRSLFLSTVVNGVVAAPLMIMTMLMSEKKLIVRQFRLPLPKNRRLRSRRHHAA